LACLYINGVHEESDGEVKVHMEAINTLRTIL